LNILPSSFFSTLPIISVTAFAAKDICKEIIQFIMRHFCTDGHSIKSSVLTNKKFQRFSTIAVVMIASTLTKFSRVVSFSTNTRFYNSRASIPNFFFNAGSGKFASAYKRRIFLSAIDEDESISIDRTWDLGGLRKEVTRLTVRCHKKTGKANERLRKAQDEVDRLTSTEDVTMEELEKCPNLDELEEQVEELRTRLRQLNHLEVQLADIKGKTIVLPEHIAKLAISLEVNDEPPQRQPRGAKKKKGPKVIYAFRLPYRRFYTVNKTEIRVSGLFDNEFRRLWKCSILKALHCFSLTNECTLF